MALPSMFFQGKRVSHSWYYVLTELERRGLFFRLNSGQRTMGEQQALVNEKGVWSPSNPRGAASPSPTAPHIMVGHEDHALDIDTFVGVGAQGVARELREMGIAMSFTVPPEPWHEEADSEEELIRVARKYERPITILDRLKQNALKRGSRTPDVIAIQIWLKRGGFYHGQIAKNVGTFGPALVVAVKAFQRKVGLLADGVVGPKTAAAMRRRYGWKVWKRTHKPKR